jgi:coiled-coil domain-containing protein 130
MPFNIFCLHCDGHIAQGVRFNAEKKKIGKYYSTPIFSFRMKHSVCSGWIEIQTDPKNTAYVAVEGAKKQAAEADPGVGVIRVKDPEEISRLEDPFAKAEKKVVDKTEAKQGAERIAELQGLSDRQWQDPYEYSRKMRKIFRVYTPPLENSSTRAFLGDVLLKVDYFASQGRKKGTSRKISCDRGYPGTRWSGNRAIRRNTGRCAKGKID